MSGVVLGGLSLILAFGTFVMNGIRTMKETLMPRVWYRDGLYYITVRNSGEWNEIRDFIQPQNPEVMKTILECGSGSAWECFDWVCRNIDYRSDQGEFFQYPHETVMRQLGDCEDSTILLTSMLRNFTNAYAVLGEYLGYGHAWVEMEDGQIYETTLTQAMTVPDPEHYVAYVKFNDREVYEMWPGALKEVFGVSRNECAKLTLRDQMLQELPICFVCSY